MSSMHDDEIFFLGHLRYMMHLRRASLNHVAWHRFAYLTHRDDRVFNIRLQAFALRVSSKAAITQWEHTVFDSNFDNPAVEKFFGQAKVSKEEITFSLEACGLPAPAISRVRELLGFRGLICSPHSQVVFLQSFLQLLPSFPALSRPC